MSLMKFDPPHQPNPIHGLLVVRSHTSDFGWSLLLPPRRLSGLVHASAPNAAHRFRIQGVHALPGLRFL